MNKTIIKIRFGLKHTHIKYKDKYFKNRKEAVERAIKYLNRTLKEL